MKLSSWHPAVGSAIAAQVVVDEVVVVVEEELVVDDVVVVVIVEELVVDDVVVVVDVEVVEVFYPNMSAHLNSLYQSGQPRVRSAGCVY